MKKTSGRHVGAYSIQDKEQALLLLDQSEGNFEKVAKETESQP